MSSNKSRTRAQKERRHLAGNVAGWRHSSWHLL